MEVQSKSELKRLAALNRQDPDDPAMVLTHADLQRIGVMLKKNILDNEGLFAAINACTAVNVDGISITLEPRLLFRLKSRCLDKTNWSRWLGEIVIKQLHDYAGY